MVAENPMATSSDVIFWSGRIDNVGLELRLRRTADVEVVAARLLMEVPADISCLLTVHKRPYTFERQLAAVEQQSVTPKAICAFHNDGGERRFCPPPGLNSIPHVYCSVNCGVWARFLFCMEFTTEYVCVFDDDSVPGSRWLENCLNTMQVREGLLGTIGLIFPGTTRHGYKRVGWSNPNSRTVEVDIVGHAWFFKRDWLRYFALEPRLGGPTYGEDYHFSVALQKHLGVGTYVPPHPADNRELWGSMEGDTLGNDNVALYRQRGQGNLKKKAHQRYLASGWLPLSVRKQ